MTLPPGSKGIIIAREFIDGKWWYKLRFDDGREEWIREDKLKRS